MKLDRTFLTAITALRRNILRAVLTALGIIIGIASVIVMMEIGNGSSNAIQSTIASMGANTVLVMPGTAASGGVSFGSGSVNTLTVEDGEAIGKEVSGIKAVAPIVRARVQVIYGNKNWVPQYIYGTTPSFVDVRDWNSFAEGEMFSDRDVKSGNKVCVLGQTLVKELFQGESPIGKEVRVENVSFKVVGVLNSKGANMMGMDQDDILLAPWTTIKYRVTTSSSSTSGASNSTSSSSSTTSSTSTESTSSNQLYPTASVEFYPPVSSTNTVLSKRVQNVDQILLAAESLDIVPVMMEDLTALLKQRHKIKPGQPDDFMLRDMAEMSKAMQSTSSLMTRLLLGVALISLIVGGVGIMNIMLVSVTERTKEIGLRMAVGARSKDILQQFLVEAIVLCVTGGIIGILLGRAISFLIATFLAWPVAASLPAVISAFLVSVTVGIVFGYYPAGKAAKLDPIEALRYE